VEKYPRLGENILEKLEFNEFSEFDGKLLLSDTKSLKLTADRSTIFLKIVKEAAVVNLVDLKLSSIEL
jgi:hypothetical protein